MKIATVSLNQFWEDKKENLLLCSEYIQKALDKNIDLIIFPEMTLTGFSTNIEKISEDENNSETIKDFKKLAKDNNIAILFGIVIKDNHKALNKSIFIDKNGKIIGEYIKIYPFSFSGENNYFNAGDKLVAVDFMNHKIGLTICYDLRFPELYSAYSKNCDLIINIASWPAKRLEHWNILLKARAIENQLFIVGVNRIGVDGNNLEYEESSDVFNANGDAIKYQSIKDIKIFEIEKSYTKEFKSKFNTTNDRKRNFYKEII
jgi:predicted amidohydrolase